MEQDDFSVLDRVRSSLDGSSPTQRRRQYRRIPLQPRRYPSEISRLVSLPTVAEPVERRFGDAIKSFLDAEGTASYTSFRRALCACLLELADTAVDDRTDILTPAFCSSDFPDEIEGSDLEALRYDIDPGTLSADVASLESLPTENALAVVVINVL